MRACSLLATAVDVERFFSKGRLCITHTRSRLSVQTTRSILCLNEWSRLGLVRKKDLKKASLLEDIEGEDSDYEMTDDDWDAVCDISDDGNA